MSIAVSNFVNTVTSGAGASSLTYSSYTSGNNVRIIVCVAVHDYLNSGVGSIVVSGLGLNWHLARSITNSPTTTGGELWNQVWYSDHVPSSVNGNITANISGGGTHRISMLIFEATDLTTDNALIENAEDDNAHTGTSPYVGTITTTNKKALVIASMSEATKNNLFSTPFSSYLDNLYTRNIESGGTTPYADHVTLSMCWRINTSVGTYQASSSVSTSTEFANLLIAFAGAAEIDISHTTDTLLKTTTDLSHTTDSLLKEINEKQHTTDSLLVGTSSVFNTSDVLLKKTSIVQHSADMFVKPPSRSPILRNLLINNIPSGINVGQYSVKILGMHGNAEAAQKFTYTLPSQEFVIGKSLTAQFNIIDTIIKKKI